MKNKLFSILVVLLTVLIFVPTVRASSFTLGNDYSYVSLNGSWVVGQITGSQLNGSSIGPVICDDTGDESYLGATWQVNVESLAGPWITQPMFASAGVASYKAAAVLDYDLGLAINANQQDQNLLQAAIWDIFRPGTGTALVGLPTNSDQTLITQAFGEISSFTYVGSEIITPVGTGVGNQEFLLVKASPVPESSPLLLLLFGALLSCTCVGLRRYRTQ
jgi:hypothetical protein